MNIINQKNKDMKKIEAINLHGFLSSHDKFGKMGLSKVTLVMMLVKLGKVVEEYNNTQKEVLEKLKNDIKDFDENLTKAQEYEKAVNEKKEELPWTEEEYRKFMDGDYKKVIEPLQEAMKEESEKDVEVDYKKFDEQGYSEWIEANNIDAVVAAQLAKYLLDY